MKICIPLFLALYCITANAYLPCGESGTTAERIQACKKNANSSRYGWDLVTFTTIGHAVWQQPGGLLWGDKLEDSWSINGSKDEIYPFKMISASCAKMRDENGSMSFRAPTIEEYNQAEALNLREVLPNTQNDFWINSTVTGDGMDHYAFTYHGRNGQISSDLKDYFYALRCVGNNP